MQKIPIIKLRLYSIIIGLIVVFFIIGLIRQYFGL